MRRDKYSSHDHLSKSEKEGEDWDVKAQARKKAHVLVMSPHAGRIEPQTGKIAKAIAGKEFSLYSFRGWKKKGKNHDLHISSHRFNEQRAVKIVRNHDVVVAIHGCKQRGERAFIGGLDDDLIETMVAALAEAGISVETDHPDFKGTHPKNICNRGKSKAGVQFELSLAFRTGKSINTFIKAVRTVLLARQNNLAGVANASALKVPRREL